MTTRPVELRTCPVTATHTRCTGLLLSPLISPLSYTDHCHFTALNSEKIQRKNPVKEARATEPGIFSQNGVDSLNHTSYISAVLDEQGAKVAPLTSMSIKSRRISKGQKILTHGPMEVALQSGQFRARRITVRLRERRTVGFSPNLSQYQSNLLQQKTPKSAQRGSCFPGSLSSLALWGFPFRNVWLVSSADCMKHTPTARVLPCTNCPPDFPLFRRNPLVGVACHYRLSPTPCINSLIGMFSFA